jgi:peptide/nickel transport system permease protein
VAARLLYGGRNSLMIAGGATVICLTLAGLVGVVAGFAGGFVDAVLARALDVLWAFPVYLLAISLSAVLISHGLQLGPVTVSSDSLLIPIAIIGLVYVPYVARPVRGQVLGLARSDFVLAARCMGVPRPRILVKDILPNVMTTLIVFAPLMMALNMLTEAALSFLSIGVQPPAASWGTIILDGEGLLYTRPMVAVAPGIAIMVTVVALNFFGDGVREAFDPRAKLRVQK